MKITIGKYPGPRSKRERVIKIRVDPWDSWSADHTLALIIHPLLIQLKETKHGAPYVSDDDVPEELKSTSAPPRANEWDVDANHFKRWDWVLDEMIWAMGEILRGDWELQYHTGETDIFWEEVEVAGEKLYEMKRGPADTRRFDKEGYDKHWRRIQNGTRLFGVHFSSLWD